MGLAQSTEAARAKAEAATSLANPTLSAAAAGDRRGRPKGRPKDAAHPEDEETLCSATKATEACAGALLLL